MMNGKVQTALLGGALALACATGGGAGGLKFHQADDVRPKPRQLADDAQRATLKDALVHLDRADAAQRSGNLDEARVEWKSAADTLSSFVERFANSEWRIVMRLIASETYDKAGDHEAAAAQAEKIEIDPEANAASRAYAARLAAFAWQSQAVKEARSGKLEPVRLLDAAKRKGEEPKPRTPPGAWKRFVGAVDGYISVAGDDPLLKQALAAGQNPPAQLALLAAEVEYAFDNMEDSRRRFEHILRTWPSDAEAMDAAVPLYLQTFLVMKEGGDAYLAAVDEVKGIVEAEAKKATAAAQAPGAKEQEKKSAQIFTRLDDQLAKEKQGSGFFAAKNLLDAGKPAEAAAAFEAFASQAKDSPDAPLALYNAGVAWDKANKPKRADAARERLVQEYPDAKVTPRAILALAGSRSRREGNHAAAERLYARYLEKYPQGEQRCLALLNIGYELDELKRQADAATRYREYGQDPRCAKEDPNGAARALYRAGALFLEEKKTSEARDAWQVLASMAGLSDAIAKSQAEDARKRLKTLKLK